MFNSKSKHTYFEKKKKRKKGNKLNATCIEKLYCQFKTIKRDNHWFHTNGQLS